MLKKTKPKTRVAFVLDKSGSMDSIKHDVIRAYNTLAADILKNSQEQDQDITVSLFTFSNNVHTQYFNANPGTLKPLDTRSYVPDGLTALFDGVGKAIESLQSLPDAKDPDTSFLVIVVTDGEENASHQFGAARITQMLKETQATDRWSFAFQLPPNRSIPFASRFGIPLDNIREWQATREGTQQVEQTTTRALGTFFKDKAAGKMSTQSFYATTDLSNVTPKDVKNELDDVSNRFKVFTVEKEVSVREFVEAKTKRPYVIGSTFYMLMKPEKVQRTKTVLLMEKGKAAIWGGDKARTIIGLPADKDAKVTPGNHSMWDIFVKSTSVNRILPRGTKVLVDTTKSRDDSPTWNHNAPVTQAA